jgi:cation transport ATPase
VAFAAEKAKTFIESEAISEIPGMGMRGTFARRETDGDIPIKYEAALGSQVLIESLAPGIISKNIYATQQLSRWQNQSKSVAILALRPFSESASNSHSHPWKLSVCLATTDPIRPSALPTIQNLQARGIEVYILSGDNPTTAAAVGNSLGIPISNIFAGVLPAEKAAKIKYLQDTLPRRRSASGFLTRLLRKNHHSSSIPTPAKARIAFIGDGINDAPALQAATLSISLASGSPIAQSSSSFILLSPTQSLTSIPLLLDLSARVFRRVKFNYAWALVYNIVLVPVAAGVLFSVNGGGWRLGPVWAAAAMAGSSVSVVLSSLALRWESSSERGGFWGWLGRGERK